MKKKIHLRNARRVKIKKANKILIVMFLITIFIIIALNRINKAFTPIILETAELEINKFSTIVVNKAISQVLEDKINTDKLFFTVTDDKGNIQTIDFNPTIVNQVLNIATTVVQDNLKLLEQGNLDNIGIYDMNLDKSRLNKMKKGIITEIPIGVIFNNSILSNIGPKIPIRLHYLGDVNSNIKTKIKSYGINNAFVEVGIHLEMTAQIVLPFLTEKMRLDCDIPLAIKMIQGNIPNYYGSGLVKDSSLYSLPFE